MQSLDDCPFPLFDAIQRGLVVLSWEQLPREEQPSRRIWDNDAALVEHFERVDRERERKFKVGGSGSIDDPVTNDAARSLIAG